MRIHRKPKNKYTAPACIYFTQARNEDGDRQLCIYAECAYSGERVGPTWSHTDAAIRRCLATLSSQCGCGRRFHRHRYSEGHRVGAKSDV